MQRSIDCDDMARPYVVAAPVEKAQADIFRRASFHSGLELTGCVCSSW